MADQYGAIDTRYETWSSHLTPSGSKPTSNISRSKLAPLHLRLPSAVETLTPLCSPTHSTCNTNIESMLSEPDKKASGMLGVLTKERRSFRYDLCKFGQRKGSCRCFNVTGVNACALGHLKCSDDQHYAVNAPIHKSCPREKMGVALMRLRCKMAWQQLIKSRLLEAVADTLFPGPHFCHSTHAF